MGDVDIVHWLWALHDVFFKSQLDHQRGEECETGIHDTEIISMLQIVVQQEA